MIDFALFPILTQKILRKMVSVSISSPNGLIASCAQRESHSRVTNAKNISLKDIAYAANISQREALRTFRNHLNLTPFAFLMEYRLRTATVQLTDTTAPVSQIEYDCGFSYYGSTKVKEEWA